MTVIFFSYCGLELNFNVEITFTKRTVLSLIAKVFLSLWIYKSIYHLCQDLVPRHVEIGCILG